MDRNGIIRNPVHSILEPVLNYICVYKADAAARTTSPRVGCACMVSTTASTVSCELIANAISCTMSAA